MRATADIDFDAGMIGVGVLLPVERLDVALAVLVDVIDDPPRPVARLRVVASCVSRFNVQGLRGPPYRPANIMLAKIPNKMTPTTMYRSGM